jgi:hypothetical protein
LVPGVVGKPVADPKAIDLAFAGDAKLSETRGEAVLVGTSGDAILTPVDG